MTAKLPLVNMNVLVTGGGSGIGLACATSFYRDGANVTLMGRSEARLAEARAALEALAHYRHDEALVARLRAAVESRDDARLRQVAEEALA